MALSFPRDELLDYVRDLSGLPDDLVIWDGDDAEPVVGPRNGDNGALMRLSLVSNVPKFGDDFEAEYDEDEDVNRITQISHRVITVQVYCESFHETSAMDHLEQVRTRMRRPQYKAVFRDDVGGTLIDAASLFEPGYVAGNRAGDSAVLEFRFEYAYTDTYEEEFIESIEVTPVLDLELWSVEDPVPA